MSRLLVAVLAASALVLNACTGLQGGSEPHDDGSSESTVASEDRFCDAMAHLIVLLEPTGSSSPTEARATFDEAATWFEQAGDAAPAAISSDVATYVAAFAKCNEFFDEVDRRLDIVFSTPGGHDLAIETSHALTPAIFGYATDECGLSFDHTA